MKRAFGLIELLVILALLGLFSPLITQNFTKWKQQYEFSRAKQTIDQALFEAQLFSMLTGQGAHVIFHKEGSSPWYVQVEFYAEKHPLLKRLQHVHELQGVQTIQDKDDGDINIEFLPPFGACCLNYTCVDELEIKISSFRGVCQRCGLSLEHAHQKNHPIVFSDSLLHALGENSE